MRNNVVLLSIMSVIATIYDKCFERDTFLQFVIVFHS